MLSLYCQDLREWCTDEGLVQSEHARTRLSFTPKNKTSSKTSGYIKPPSGISKDVWVIRFASGTFRYWFIFYNIPFSIVANQHTILPGTTAIPTVEHRHSVAGRGAFQAACHHNPPCRNNTVRRYLFAIAVCRSWRQQPVFHVVHRRSHECSLGFPHDLGGWHVLTSRDQIAWLAWAHPIGPSLP